jgi:GT2 family glycosyltransferase
MSYLKEPGRLAVMPSLVDNYPNAVLECVGAGIPFLASNSGGIPEIIAEEDRHRVCFQPQVSVLADRLSDALDEGGVQARPSFSFSDVERRWVNWHAALVNQNHGKAPARLRKPSAREEPIFPLVSVCFAYDPREKGAEAAVASLKEQDYPRIEVIVARCGASNTPADPLADIAADFSAERLHRIEVRNIESGAARNGAVLEAKGEYLFFIDDHTTLLSPATLSIFVQVAQRTGADLVTSTLSFVLGLAGERYEHSRRPFLGGDIASGAFVNSYGSSNALIRRTAFDAIGGFSEDAATTLDDWEIFSKAALMGLKIESIPEPLIGYREDQEQESLVHSFVNAVRSVRPYTMPGRKVAPQVEPLLAKAVLLSQGLKFERDATIGTPLSRGEQGPAVTG